MIWIAEFDMVLDMAGLSKNKQRTIRGGQIKNAPLYTATVGEVAWRTKEAVQQGGYYAEDFPPLPDGKLWLDIRVRKPKVLLDAINVLDAVADGVKLGTGLDDHWYSVYRLDWELAPQEEGLLTVRLGRAPEHVR